MNTVDLVRSYLSNAFEILGQVTEDLTQEQADWIPPGCANPIGSLYWHTISSTDEIVHRWARGDAQCLHEREGWRAKALTVDAPDLPHGENWLEWMRTVRIDLPAMRAYAQAVAADLDAWLATLSPADLECPVQTPLGDLTIAVILGTFVIWHTDAHCGEISALKGCQGARGYPF